MSCSVILNSWMPAEPFGNPEQLPGGAMAEPRYRYQEARCDSVTLSWLPAEAPDDLARPDEESPPLPPTRHTPPLRPHVHNRPRDVVRHHRERAVRHAAEVARTVRHVPEEDVPRLARRWADNLQACSCDRCGNPRRWFGRPTVHELRLAEREAVDAAELVPPEPDWHEDHYRDDYPDGPREWPPLVPAICATCETVDCYRHCSPDRGACERCQTDRAHPGGFCSRVPSMRVDYDD